MNTQTQKRPNKAQRRLQQLARHYSALEKIAAVCGIVNPDGKKLSLKLWKLETEARKLTVMKCNGEGDKFQIFKRLNEISLEVYQLFNNEMFFGFYINEDARGHALKINDTEMRTIYKDSGLQTDMGGDGMLSPDIDGSEN